MRDNLYAPIPMSWIGPAHISGNVVSGETAGWNSEEDTQTPESDASYEAVSISHGDLRNATLAIRRPRGKSIALRRRRSPCYTLVDERMTRSVYFEAPNAGVALRVAELDRRRDELQAVVAQASRFAKLIPICTSNTPETPPLRSIRIHHRGRLRPQHGHRPCLRQPHAVDPPAVPGTALRIDLRQLLLPTRKPPQSTASSGVERTSSLKCSSCATSSRERLKTTPEQIANLNVRKNLGRHHLRLAGCAPRTRTMPISPGLLPGNWARRGQHCRGIAGHHPCRSA